MHEKQSITVIIPAYNEEDRLGSTLDEVWEYMSERWPGFDIIVVDDGSTDQTAKVAREKSVVHPNIRLISYSPNRGKGFAVKTGMLEGTGDILSFCDADLSIHVNELEAMVPKINSGYDIAIASRAVPGAERTVPPGLIRILAGKTLNCFIKLFLIRGIQDTQCGFKVFRKEAAKRIFSILEEERFGFDIEALFLARKFGYNIAEMPVRCKHIEGSKVRPLHDAPKVLATIFRCRFKKYPELKNGQ